MSGTDSGEEERFVRVPVKPFDWSAGGRDAVIAGSRRRSGYCGGPPGLWLGISVIGRFGAGLSEGVAGSGGMRPAGMSAMSLAAGPLTRLP